MVFQHYLLELIYRGGHVFFGCPAFITFSIDCIKFHWLQMDSEEDVLEKQLPSLDIRVDLPPPSCDNDLSVKVFICFSSLKSIIYLL